MAIERMGFETNKRIHKKFGNISQTVTIGGKECRFRSLGEKRLANYLELLKISGHIQDWAFEQTTFRTSAGEPFYIVDFDILNTDGTFEYMEFKGMYKQSDNTKLQLLFECKPEIQFTMVFEDRTSAAKFARRKVSRFCKRVCLLTARGLMDFDGKTTRKRK